MKKITLCCIGLLMFCLSVTAFFPEGKAQEKKQAEKPPVRKQIEMPRYAVDITKENTYTNTSNIDPELQPGKLTKALMKTSDVPVENPDLIKMLNESAVRTTPLAIGYRASIYLGRWPLQFISESSHMNWEYGQVNKNEIDNRGGDTAQKLSYNQNAQAEITGKLTAGVQREDEVKKLILASVMEDTRLPVAFHTVVGKGTKVTRDYQVGARKLGQLFAYVPAVNEKGTVTYGEVYLTLKGSKKYLDIKNVTRQKVGAWLPLQDTVSLKYYTPAP